MAADDVISAMNASMKKTMEFIEGEFHGIRTGKASPALVEGVMVDYYGNPTRVKELANISVPESRMIVLQPWDPQSIPAIEKAIKGADLGINPMNDGKVIRLPIPALSEERRKDMIKVVKKKAEEGKVAIRGERRTAMEGIKQAEKAKEITEDDRALYEEDIQKATNDKIKQIDEILKNKEVEIMVV